MTRSLDSGVSALMKGVDQASSCRGHFHFFWGGAGLRLWTWVPSTVVGLIPAIGFRLLRLGAFDGKASLWRCTSIATTAGGAT